MEERPEAHLHIIIKVAPVTTPNQHFVRKLRGLRMSNIPTFFIIFVQGRVSIFSACEVWLL